jgi:hypothetical protein
MICKFLTSTVPASLISSSFHRVRPILQGLTGGRQIILNILPILKQSASSTLIIIYQKFLCMLFIQLPTNVGNEQVRVIFSGTNLEYTVTLTDKVILCVNILVAFASQCIFRHEHGANVIRSNNRW